MKLTSRRARRLFVLCSVGAVVGAGVSATQAHAVGETLAFGPTPTSATILNIDPTGATNGATTYGFKVTGTTSTDALRLRTISGPSSLYIQSGNPATPNAVPVATAAASSVTLSRALTGDGTTHTTTAIDKVTSEFKQGDVGATITGTDIPVSTTLSSVTSGTAATLSQAASGSTAGTAAFTIRSVSRDTADGATTSGSTTVTSATMAFTANDLGAAIVGTNIPAGATISSVTNATTVVISAAATGTGAGQALGVGRRTLRGISTAGANTLTANATVTTHYATLAAHFIKISSPGEPTEIAAVSTDVGTTITVDRPLAAHNGAVIQDMGTVAGTPYGFTTAAVSTTGTQVLNYSDSNNNANIFVGATVPGTYTFQVFKDHNGNSVYDSAQDDATPVFTLTVKDVNANTSSVTTDDWAPSITVPSSLSVGQRVPTTISTGELTTTDTRGTNPSSSVAYLGEAVAATMTVGYAQTAGITDAPAAPTWDGSNFTKQSSVTSSTTNPVVVTIAGVASTSTTRSVSITSNLVASVTSGATDVVGSAKLTGTAEAVKTGTATVAYTATVTVSSGDVSGKTVYFTLTPGTNTPTLTADGTLVSNTSGTKVYTAVTNTSGVATLNVTSGTTTAGTTYTVAPSSNTFSGSTLTATYADAAASTFALTTPSAGMYPTVGGSVAVAGTLNDQFGAAFQPLASATQQVTVTVDQNASSYSSADVTVYATLAAGAFSWTYTPATAATAGIQDIVRFAYSGATSLDSSVYWTTASAPAAVSITAPVASASVTQQKATIAPIAGTAVTGLVTDASNAAMAYKSVTLTGTPGVYFSTVATPAALLATDDLATTVTVAANASGTYTGYAFFMKSGAATITATSGTATSTVNVVVTQVSDPYTATVTGGTVEPGGTSVVTGSVTNGWGHPVTGATVNLSLGASTIASLASSSVTTNSDGVWSTTVTGSSSGSGTATLTATLNGLAANATPHANWLANDGLTIANGVYQATATVTVDPTLNETTITAPTSRVGAGYVTLSGRAKPSTSVEIYGKEAASSAAYGLVGLVTSGADGSWSTSQYLSATSTFFAKTSVSTSPTLTVTVTSVTPPVTRLTVSLGATATGRGHVRLAANGGPWGRGTLKFYRQTKTGWLKVRTVRANVAGDATVTVTSPRGNQTFRVVYSVTGHGSASANKSVRVR